MRTIYPATAMIAILAVAQPAAAQRPEITSYASTSRQDIRPEGADLEALIAYAASTHPQLARQHASWGAVRAMARARDVRPNPMVSYMFAPLPVQTRNGPLRQSVMVKQRLPWFGVTDQDRAIDEARADVIAHRFDDAYLVLRYDIERAYWSTWELDRQLDVLARELALLELIEQSLTARVEAGLAPAASLARLGLKHSKLTDRRAALGAARDASLIRLNVALGATEDLGIVVPADTSPPGFDPPADIEALIASASPPALRELDAAIHARQEEAARVELARRPDLEVGAQWSQIGKAQVGEMQTSGRDAVSLQVGVSLPIWTDSIDARADAANARVVSQRAELELARARWAAEVRLTARRASDARERITYVQDTMLPRASSAIELVRGDWEAGRANLTDLLATIDQVYELETQMHRARAELAKQGARWRMLLGATEDEAKTP